MSSIIRDLAYQPNTGTGLTGDLHLPDLPENAGLVILIHGGAWLAMTRRKMEGNQPLNPADIVGIELSGSGNAGTIYIRGVSFYKKKSGKRMD